MLCESIYSNFVPQDQSMRSDAGFNEMKNPKAYILNLEYIIQD
ncbi:MAG TPA: hypothetical protein PLX15_05020 [Candidatus Woesearchaeota archaeon]|mgnify:CR=1 FL=1|nr:hypothetical protein [Candidatus Woesearchaeota archaeon]